MAQASLKNLRRSAPHRWVGDNGHVVGQPPHRGGLPKGWTPHESIGRARASARGPHPRAGFGTRGGLKFLAPPPLRGLVSA